MDNVDWDVVNLRIEGIRAAQTRSRVAFATCLILSLAMGAALFNAYFSWYRFFTTKELPEEGSPARILRTELLSQWTDGRSFELPFLGIPVLPSDASSIGGMALCMCSLWFFYCVRRENHSIAYLLGDFGPSEKELLRNVFHAISSRLVFSTISLRDTAYDSLDTLPPAGDPPSGPGLRKTTKLLIYVPGLMVATCIIADTATLFMPSPFRPDNTSPWDNRTTEEILHFIFFNSVGFILAVATLRNCWRAEKFEEATISLLRQLHEKVYANNTGEDREDGLLVSSGNEPHCFPQSSGA